MAASSAAAARSGRAPSMRLDATRRRLRVRHLSLTLCACWTTFSTDSPMDCVQLVPEPMAESMLSPRACTVTSVRRSRFSCVSTTWIDTTLSLSSRSRRASRRVTSCRSGGVTVM